MLLIEPTDSVIMQNLLLFELRQSDSLVTIASEHFFT